MLGIYLHWPFCLSRCTYCDFLSCTDAPLMPEYARALGKEIRRNGRIYDKAVDTVFFGGGTPSSAGTVLLEKLLGTLRTSFTVTEDSEITMEANPVSADAAWLAHMRSAGVNRLSLGLQSSSDALLKMLGRAHSVADFQKTFENARRAGFENISLDLLYGLPGQTMAQWEDALAFAVSLKPEHLSIYCLTLEPGTQLASEVRSGKIPAPDEDLAADMYSRGARYLQSHGLERYEISNFAKPGMACRHNLKYWHLEDYLGFGAAAHSMTRRLRFSNTRSIHEYIRRAARERYPLTQAEFISGKERAREFFMLFTRCAEGFTPQAYEEVTGKSFSPAGRTGLLQAENEGLLEESGGRYIPTDKGFLFQNRLASLLMDDVK